MMNNAPPDTTMMIVPLVVLKCRYPFTVTATQTKKINVAQIFAI
jgi:hypothetical protein